MARIVWRIVEGTDPATVCALTFNRRAAEELQERVDAAAAEIGLQPGSVRVRTFHALGREILMDAGVDVRRIVERGEVLDDISAGQLTAAGHRWLDEAFTRLKLDPDRGPPAEDLATHAAFSAYTAELRRRRSIDLDDLIAQAVPALLDDTALLERWRGRCATLFIDEAQDLDRSQLELALTLSGERRDVFLVGDDDQTIYAWRLADVRRVLGLASRLPGLRRVDLETNHRSAPEIVARAARLVAHNRERFDKRILSSSASSGEVRLAPDPGDDVSRARRLLETWARLDRGTHAVLARTNRELAPYAAVAGEIGMAVEVAEDGLLTRDDDADALVRRGAALAEEGRMPPLLATRMAARELGSSTSVAGSVLSWAAAHRDFSTFVAAWQRAKRPQREPTATPEDTVTLATVHATKGLEWDHVACVGFDANAFPAARALAEATEPERVLEEERRLAYVAWTRARTTLTIVYDPAEPSRFLLDAFDYSELV